MKFCTHCGAEINEDAVICVKCGCSVKNKPNTGITVNAGTEQDKPNFGFAFLGFCIPLVGLILFLTWKDKTPLKAKSCGKGALIGFIINLVAFGIITCVSVMNQL